MEQVSLADTAPSSTNDHVDRQLNEQRADAVKQQADVLWAGERMSSGEIGRRYILAGLEKMQGMPEEELKALRWKHQVSKTAVRERDERKPQD
jgi:hypothetical protein